MSNNEDEYMKLSKKDLERMIIDAFTVPATLLNRIEPFVKGVEFDLTMPLEEE